jgi:Fe2+ transport system protein B
VLFFILNTAVEVALVRKLHAALKEKKRRVEEMEMRSHVEEARVSLMARMSFRKLRKQEMEAKSEQRAIIMVIINAFINFFLRLPELFFLFSVSKNFFGDKQLMHVFDTFPALKFFWIDLAYFCYILTFATNFLIYYLFNQKFKLTFSERSRIKRNVASDFGSQ